MKRVLRWINYWLVPDGATTEDANRRVVEVGFLIGFFIFGSIMMAGRLLWK